MISSRQAALLTLERCRKDDAWVSAVLDGVIKKEGLDRRDSSLATALVLDVLQNRTFYDFLISRFCTLPPEKLEKRVLDILRLGVCQLVSLDRIPPRAAVNETVGLCASSGVPRASSLVNAVLRKIAENSDKLPEVPGVGTAEYLAVRYSHPLWLAEHFFREKGYAFTEALFAADNNRAPLDIQINTCRTTREDYLHRLQERAIPYEIPPFPDACISLSGGSVGELPGFDEGLFFIQDRAARTAVEIASLRSGMRVLDACASPGGKSFAAAMDMDNRGEIVSCDIHEKKLSLIRESAGRLGLELIRTECRDAREFASDYENAFDAVIADVPCSGLGVLRKKPEIRSKKAEEIRSLPAIQRDILANLARYVRPGGILLYCTCTILCRENENIIEEFLSAHADYSPCDFAVGERHSENGCYTFFPHIDRTDGFFVSKLIRKNG